MVELRTRQGFRMNRSLRFRVVQILAKRPELSLRESALQLGIARRTLNDYMTDDVKEAVAKLREELVTPTLENVDKAMMQLACKGNVAAARLVYLRMAQRGDTGPLPSLEDMEAELERLKFMELNKEGLNNGETAGDVAAVGIDAAG